jgi:hypothetical protein
VWKRFLPRAVYPKRGSKQPALEVVTIVRDDGSELAIHAMKMRAKYERLSPGR